jgi:hypothetical protein
MRLCHVEATSEPKPDTHPMPVTTTFFTLPNLSPQLERGVVRFISSAG